MTNYLKKKKLWKILNSNITPQKRCCDGITFFKRSMFSTSIFFCGKLTIVFRNEQTNKIHENAIQKKQLTLSFWRSINSKTKVKVSQKNQTLPTRVYCYVDKPYRSLNLMTRINFIIWRSSNDFCISFVSSILHVKTQYFLINKLIFL
jgi:hypothetical protein